VSAPENPEDSKPKDSKFVLYQQAFAALEADVARAGALAKDLNIPRPPLNVAAPTTKGKSPRSRGSWFFKSFPQLKKEYFATMWWKAIVSLCAVTAVWLYLYQFAFQNSVNIAWSYAFHLTDLIFLVDFVFDSLQVVITPQSELTICVLAMYSSNIENIILSISMIFQ